jgi:hypothetical protein
LTQLVIELALRVVGVEFYAEVAMDHERRADSKEHYRNNSKPSISRRSPLQTAIGFTDRIRAPDSRTPVADLEMPVTIRPRQRGQRIAAKRIQRSTP